MITDAFDVFAVFWAGFLTFFASCLTPLAPSYVAYLAGINGNTDIQVAARARKKILFVNTSLFVLGFLTIFMVFGMTAAHVGNWLGQNRILLQKISGVFLVVMGIFMFDIWKPEWLLKEWKFNISNHVTRFRELNSYLVGLTFGFAWTPCIGPILASILLWVGLYTTKLTGILLLGVFGLGLGLPFILLALLFDRLVPVLHMTKVIGRVFQILAAVLIIGFGTLLVFGRLDLLSFQLVRILGLDTLTL